MVIYMDKCVLLQKMSIYPNIWWWYLIWTNMCYCRHSLKGSGGDCSNINQLSSSLYWELYLFFTWNAILHVVQLLFVCIIVNPFLIVSKLICNNFFGGEGDKLSGNCKKEIWTYWIYLFFISVKIHLLFFVYIFAVFWNIFAIFSNIFSTKCRHIFGPRRR